MFWGMNLKPNRKYSQTTGKAFHISQAALDPEGADDAVNKIFISGEDNQKYLICTLRKKVCEQVQLELNFEEGETICFQSIGSGNVSLSGYLVVDSPFFGDEEEEEDEESDVENALALTNGKPQKKKVDKKGQTAASKKDVEEDEDDDEDDDDEDDDAIIKALEGDDDDDDDEDDDDEDEEMEEDDSEEEDDEDEEDEEVVEEPKRKIAKIEKKDNKQQQNGAQKSKKDKKAEKQQQQQPQKNQQQQQQKSGGERTLTGGVKIEDIRVGNGEEAKSGKRAQVYYEGRLKSNNKVFDSLLKGAPFKFGIGRGEVIKAWDVGVAGMKVGGKRRITCPPHMAYGARGSPPAIPPNSTLVFEVELKGVAK